MLGYEGIDNDGDGLVNEDRQAWFCAAGYGFVLF